MLLKVGKASRWNAFLIKHVFNVFLTVGAMRNNKTILPISFGALNVGNMSILSPP